MLASVFIMLASCKIQDQKLQISPIYAKPKKLIKSSSEDGKAHLATSLQEVTERLQPLIATVSPENGKLELSIQGNISSAGLSVKKVRKIRFEETELEENFITLRYIVEIRKTPGKESADVRGYNYTQGIRYQVPKGTKQVKLELYENHVGDRFVKSPILVFEKTLNYIEIT
ncbi:hypothetical protein ACFSQW_16875 [Sphingobacterium tabacisoli]|uniref:Lipoprotein n=2 Tax=Sphingobacterium tabacisoli TaxID=2044855 RepID=A0ABW5L4V6_9SPHI